MFLSRYPEYIINCGKNGQKEKLQESTDKYRCMLKSEKSDDAH